MCLKKKERPAWRVCGGCRGSGEAEVTRWRRGACSAQRWEATGRRYAPRRLMSAVVTAAYVRSASQHWRTVRSQTLRKELQCTSTLLDSQQVQSQSLFRTSPTGLVWQHKMQYDTFISYDAIQFHTLSYNAIQHNKIRYARHNLMRWNVLWYNTICYDTKGYDTEWNYTMRSVSLRYDSMQYETFQYDMT